MNAVATQLGDHISLLETNFAGRTQTLESSMAKLEQEIQLLKSMKGGINTSSKKLINKKACLNETGFLVHTYLLLCYSPSSLSANSFLPTLVLEE